MAKTRCFVSYDHSEDAHYKRLLQAWDANADFEFDFDSRGPNEPIDSAKGHVIRASLTSMMKSATHLLVLVGAKTSQSRWVSWEIERSRQPDVRLRVAAVRLAPSNPIPVGLVGLSTSWARAFERDLIVQALRRAVPITGAG